MRGRGRLSFDPPESGGEELDEYGSDPKKPDVLVYETAPLAEAVTVAGPIGVSFCVSTSGTDSNWVVKLIDVLAEDGKLGGYQMLVRGDAMRGKFRNGLSKPSIIRGPRR